MFTKLSRILSNSERKILWTAIHLQEFSRFESTRLFRSYFYSTIYVQIKHVTPYILVINNLG